MRARTLGTQMFGAQMWPIGQRELAESVTDEFNEVPRGCACFNVDEQETLEDGAPADEYAVRVAEIHSAARDECAFLVPAGWDHNCFDTSEDGPEFTPVGQSHVGTCIGECRSSCREVQPSPYECEEIINGGDTGSDDGADETDSDTGGPAFEPNREGELLWPR